MVHFSANEFGGDAKGGEKAEACRFIGSEKMSFLMMWRRQPDDSGERGPHREEDMDKSGERN